MGTVSAVAALAGIVQLYVSGFWERVLTPYSDVEQFPYGPPSHIVRQVISNPDTPIRTTVRDAVVFNTSTAAWLGVFSIVLGGLSVWF